MPAIHAEQSLIPGYLYSAAYRVLHLAKDKNLTIASAESLTAGLISSALAEIPGASQVLLGAVVSYSITIKEHVLGVDKTILDTPELGAVSAECAQQMAEGLSHLMGANFSISATGIAGPTGEEPGKPVGTVYLGLCVRDDFGIVSTSTKLLHIKGTRQEVRAQAAASALNMIYEAMNN